MKPIHALLLILLPTNSFAGPVDADVLRLATWMVGSFSTRAQAEADIAARTVYKHDVAFMLSRPLQDPVVFQDGLYVYVENRMEGETQPYRQRIYRLKKSGRRVRIEVLRIDASVLPLLVADPAMLANLAPGDLAQEAGCDVLLDWNGTEFSGATAPTSCKSAWKGSSYVSSTMRITNELVVTLDRGYDAYGVQTFGPTDGRGYEFRRAAP